MTRHEYPGGTYVDALPSGAFAMLVPGQHVQTHLERVPLPDGDEPLYLRVTEVGGFAFAGQAHASTRTLEYWQGTWRSRAAACGVSPVIYDRNGILHISDCSQGSQGYRYVDTDNRIWTGDETYGSPFGLSEWSAYGGLSIGQGHDGGGVKVWDGSTLRVLEEGDCRFIRVNGDGERVAIAFWKIGVGAVVYQTTLAELRALPPVVAAPPPSTEPVPQPPTPEPVPVSIPNQIATVERVLNAHGRTFPAFGPEHAAFLIDLAQQCRGKLFRKDAGDRVTLPNGISVNQNLLIIDSPEGPWWVDVLGDAESPTNRRATWDAHPNAGEPEKFLDVSGYPVPGVPQQPPQNPPPSTPPPAPSVDLSKIEALQAQVDQLRNLLIETNQRLSAQITEVHTALWNEIEATLPERIDVALTNLEVSGKTSTSFGHQHAVRLGVSRKK